MYRLCVAGVVIVLCLMVGVLPSSAQDASPAPTSVSAVDDSATGTEWPSALEMRRSLSEVGWQWGADEDLLWYGGPPPLASENWSGRVTLAGPGMVHVDEGEGQRIRFRGGSEGWVVPTDDWMLTVRMREPPDPVYGWPEIVTSDWTLLAEVIDRLPIDGVNRYEIARTLTEPDSMPQTFSVPGGMIIIEADDTPGFRAFVQFLRSSPLD